ncbi:MAG: ABC transporter permease [Chloroflexi bacterium]|nr:ABC transporter permease [Chloroflexota bacterium]
MATSIVRSDAFSPVARRSERRSALAVFFADTGARLATLTLVVFILMAALATVLAPYDPSEQERPAAFRGPSLQHPLGTDELGRDLLSRVIFGARVSLGTAAVAVTLSMLIGVPLGLAAGYFGSWIDLVAMRAMDVLLAFPAILLAMAVVTVLGQAALTPALAVTVVSTPAVVRIARAGTLSVRNLEFVLAATVIGATNWHILLRTILPNVMLALFIQAIVNASRAVLVESSLSFLGLGVPPPQASWGSLLSAGRSFIHQAPWYGLFPGLAIMVVLLSLNILADAWQDTADPVRRRARELRSMRP